MSDKRLIFIDIDGILPDVLHEVLDDKNSNMHRIGGKGLRVERAATVFPAVTLCCQASMFTGAWPGTHGILGNSWFDRYSKPTEFRYYTDAKTALGNYGFGMFGWPTIIMPQRPELQFANNDMNPEVMTVYDMANTKGLTSWNVFNQYSRGVDRWIKPSRPAMILFALCHEELLHNKHWDRSTFKHLFKAMKKQDLPDLLTFYISGHDNNSHEHGAETQLEYFREVVDPLFGQFNEHLEKHAPLDDFYFVITSDHGQAQVKKEEEYVVDHRILGEILGAAPGGGFQLAERKKVQPTDTAVGNMEAGAVQFHLINRKSFDWIDPARFEEDILPVAAAFEPYRDGDPPFIDLIMVRRDIQEGYLVYQDGDLIELEKYFDGKDMEYPDAVRRIRGLNCKRSGDIIITIDYSQGYYFGDKVKAGEHGNLCAADGLIPLIISGPGVPDATKPTASLIDVVPTVGRILGFDTPTAQGKSLLK